jgi:hypothetical protein
VSLETDSYLKKRLGFIQHGLFNNTAIGVVFLLLFRIKIVPTSSRDLTNVIKCIQIPGYSKGIGLFGII